MTAPMPKEVAAAFAEIAEEPREFLLHARKLILEMAAERGVDPLRETLKWGQPSYLTEKTKAGSTIRLGMHQGQPAAFFNCNTTLVEGFRSDFPEAFAYSGNRALLLDHKSDAAALAICIGRALTYHRDKRKARS